MKKLFISCPMRGYTDWQIAVMRNALKLYAEETFGEEFEVINTVLPPEEGHKNHAMWCLGRSIQLMADADYYIGFTRATVIGKRHPPRGCSIETMAWDMYKTREQMKTTIKYTRAKLQNLVDEYCKDRGIESFKLV